LSQELEGTLSIITTTFLRTENITEAISENIDYLKPPVKQAFENFLVESRYVNADTKKILLRFQNAFPNEVFKEWVSIIILCQDDISKKVLLRGEVSKLSDEKTVALEQSVAFFEPLKEFITMTLLVILNIPLMRILNKEWFEILVGSVPGKFVVAVSLTVVLFGVLALIKNIAPVTYKEST
jgi:hypothetical protein